jgi:uncharacterized repeat protein (TIGR01451 family)
MTKNFEQKTTDPFNFVSRWLFVSFLSLLATMATPQGARADVDWLLNIVDGASELLPALGTIKYNISVTNNGTSLAPPTTVTLAVPPTMKMTGAAYGANVIDCAPLAAAYPDDDTFPTAPTTVICNIGPLDDGESAIFTTLVQTSLEGAVNFTARVDDLNGDDIDEGNNELVENTTVVAGVDIDVDLISPVSAAAGEYIDLEIIATNNGPNAVDSFTVNFPQPSGMGNFTPPPSCALSGGIYSCPIGSLAVGVSVTLTLNGQIVVANGSTIAATTSVQDAFPLDAIASNNTDNETFEVSGGVDLAIEITSDATDTLLTGDDVTFTIEPSYTGDTPTDVVITHVIPANFDFNVADFVAPGWTITLGGPDNRTVTFTRAVGTAPPDPNRPFEVPLGAITLPMTTVLEGNPVSEVVLSSGSPPESYLPNNTSSIVTPIIDPVIDLEAIKIGPLIDLAVADPAFDYDYTISARNVGNDDFTGRIFMEDQIPAGITVNSISSSGWTCTPNTGGVGPFTLICELDLTASTLGPDDFTPAVSYNVTFTDVADIPNTMMVSATDSNLPDDNAVNDVTTVTVTTETLGDSADVRLTKAVANSTLPAGEVQTYTLEIINAGDAAAEDVSIRDDLLQMINSGFGPNKGLVEFTLNPGSHATGFTCGQNEPFGDTGRRLGCDIDTLAVCSPGDCPTIEIKVRHGGDGIAPDDSIDNEASAYSLTTPDPDLTNNVDDTTFNQERRVDITVEKTVNSASVAVGQNVTYTVAALNVDNGLSTAADVVITDTLPLDLLFVSASPASACTTTPIPDTEITADARTVICNFGTLLNGEQQAATIVVRPLISAAIDGFLTNDVVVVTATVETDVEPNFDSIDVMIDPPVTDLLVNNDDVGFDPLPVGDQVPYTITVTNRGPSASQNIVVTDTWPDSIISYVSAEFEDGTPCTTEPTPGSFGETLICEWPYLDAGESVTLVATGLAESKGNVINRVEISSFEIENGFDTLSVNNVNEENTTVRTRADVEIVSKVATPGTVALEDDFVYDITVRVNSGAGLAEAEEVVIRDELPEGMFLTGPPTTPYLAGACSTAAAGDIEFECSFGDVPDGYTFVISVPVEIRTASSDGQVFTNVAEATTPSFENDEDNNEGSGPVTVVSSEISGTVYRDFDEDVTQNLAEDTGLGGVRMELTGTTGDGRNIGTLVAFTDDNGDYIFENLPAGDYTVTRGPVSGIYANEYLDDGASDIGNNGAGSSTTLTIVDVPLGDDDIGPNNDFTVHPEPRIGLAKQTVGALVVNADGSFNVTFRMVVENFSEEQLVNVEVTDTLTGAAPLFGTLAAVGDPANDPLTAGSYVILSAPSGSCDNLIAGFNGDSEQRLASGFNIAANTDCQIDVQLRVQPPLPLPPVLASGGRFENQAEVTGEGALTGDAVSDTSDNGGNPDNNNNDRSDDGNEGDPTPVNPNWNPEITLVKISDNSGFSTPPEPLDTIIYEFEITNSGNLTLTNIVLSDPLPGIVLDTSTIASLAPSDSQTLTGSYQIDQGDIDDGERENTATVTGDDPFGEEQDDSSTQSTPIAQDPQIALIKAIDTNGIQDPTVLGDPVSYTFQVRNTGNVTLTDVIVTDPLPGLTTNGMAIASLDPGQTDRLTFTADHGVTQADIDAAEVRNQATVTAIDPNDDPVTDLSGDDFVSDNPIVLPVFQNPGIAIVKEAVTTGLSDPPLEGETVTYTFAVTNTGNTTLENVTLDDPLADIRLFGGPIVSLPPNSPADTTTFTAEYDLKQADIDLGFVENQATVEADVPGGGDTVGDLSGDTNTDDNSTVVPLEQVPSIVLIKTADVSALSIPPEDTEIVTFRFEVRNTGNVTLTNISIADTLPGIVPNGAVLASLDPGDTDTTTFVATYALSQDDVDDGEIENTAVVTGTPPSGDDVTDTSGTAFENDDPTVVDFDRLPAIALVKAADTSGLSSPPQEGDILTYTFEVTNTGNVRLTDIVISDVLPDIVLSVGPIASLEPGDTDIATFTAQYVLKQTDLDAGQVENLATVTGTPPDGPDVTDDSGSNVTEDAPTVTPLTQTPSIALVKTANDDGLQSPPQIGDEITYSFEITNTGNVTLTNVFVADLLPGIVLNGNPIGSHDPIDVDTTTITGSYILTADDMTAGVVDNIAMVTGTPPTGPDVTAEDTASVPIVQEPAITLEKIADGTALEDGSVVGEIVTYTFMITNTGNVPLSNVTLTDPLPGLVLSGGPIPLMNTAAAGDGTDVDSVTYTASYAITQTDIDNVTLENTATVTSEYGTGGDTVDASDTAEVRVGNIEAISEVFPPFLTDGGDTTSMLVSDLLNGDPATLDTVTITVLSEDPGVTLDPATGIITLAPGQPAGIYEVEYQITSIDNPGLTDTAIETVVQGAISSIEATKTQVLVDNGDGRDDVGDTVVYTISVENTGNTVLTSVGVVDTLIDLQGGAQTLTAGPDFVSADAGSPEGRLEISEIATYEVTFDITLEVVNARGLENTVEATGTPELPTGIPGDPDPVSDTSDDGDDLDGNSVDDPTILNLSPSTTTAGLSIVKTTPRRVVERGSAVPYTIVVTNENNFVVGPADVVDRLPSGFLYVAGSGQIVGSTGTVEVNGSRVTFADVTVPAEGSITLTLSARILNGTRSGSHVNTATIVDAATGDRLLAPTTATVEILPEAVFDCSDVIGKVFDDVNGNGYQDGPPEVGNNPAISDQTYDGGKGDIAPVAEGPQPERGLPGVRLVGVDGTVITTDANGLYSVPCASLPADDGSNFILKLDERSLPTGYSMTTENPRVMRLTPGMMSEMNFGARLGNVVTVNLNENAFQGGNTLSPQLVQGIGRLVQVVAQTPSGIELVFHVPADADGDEVAAARQRMALVEDEIQRQWRTIGQGRLSIEQLLSRDAQ